MLNVGSFAEYTNVLESGAIKVEDNAPLDKVCLLGCGILSGYGATHNRLDIKEGDSVAVFGLGAVGLSAC